MGKNMDGKEKGISRLEDMNRWHEEVTEDGCVEKNTKPIIRTNLYYVIHNYGRILEGNVNYFYNLEMISFSTEEHNTF